MLLDEPKAKHLHTLAHYNPLSPILARHAVALDLNAYENGLNLPHAYSHCAACGTYLIAGLTASYKIKFRKSSKPAPRRRTLHITCLGCHNIHRTDLVNKRKAPPVQAPTAKRNRKKHGLSSLLEAKRSAASAAPSLDLMHFLK